MSLYMIKLYVYINVYVYRYLFFFYGISTFLCYLMPKQSLKKYNSTIIAYIYLHI